MAGPSDAYRWGIDMLVLPVDRTGEVWVPLRKRKGGLYKFFTRDDAQWFIDHGLATSASARFKPVQLPTVIAATRRSVAASRRYV